ncbi:VOC family protein [Alkalihalobacillus sp. NPDC078783]
MNAAQIRIARPTDQLERVTEFYEKGLGLTRVGSFQKHSGYNGVMYGLPDTAYHLEFTQHIDGSPCPAPTKDNLIVFYVPEYEEIKQVTERLNELGYGEVEPENPYWRELGITIEDPDGWRIVLMNTKGLQ